MTLAPVEAGNPLAVTDYLTKARDWLATAVETTGPEQIALAKAEIATAAEATKQLGLSKEIREDATEMVRRAEWTLGKAIRRGQAEGTVGTSADGGPRGDYVRNGYVVRVAGRDADTETKKVSTSTFFKHGEEWSDTLALADNAPSAEEFEQALDESKRQGNLSRANVVRNVKKQNADQPMTRDAKADVIADLAQQGYTSHQMADRVGVSASRVREIARAYEITISADKAVGRGGQRIDHTAAVESAVTRLEHLTDSLKFIDFAEVDRSETDEWTVSLTNSIRALNRFKKQIEETIHVH